VEPLLLLVLPLLLLELELHWLAQFCCSHALKVCTAL
jgi:hypothetical protein